MSASAAIGDPLILCAKRRILIMKKKMTKSSGNVFVDLGLILPRPPCSKCGRI